MNNEENLMEIIDDIESFVEEEGRSSIFDSGSVKLEKETLMYMLARLRDSVPNEIVRGKKIVDEENKIIEEANAQAERIIAEANAQAQQTIEDARTEALAMVEENEIMKFAKKRAAEIQKEIDEYADQTVAQAKAEAKECRISALQFTQDTVEGLEDYMLSLLNAQKSNYEKIIDDIQSDIDEFQGNKRAVEAQISKIERER